VTEELLFIVGIRLAAGSNFVRSFSPPSARFEIVRADKGRFPPPEVDLHRRPFTSANSAE
jgi:hypothetical protein